MWLDEDKGRVQKGCLLLLFSLLPSRAEWLLLRSGAKVFLGLARMATYARNSPF